MKGKHKDLWTPRQGSWEEAVDPFEVQLTRIMAQLEGDPKQNSQLEKVIDRYAKYKMPASV